MKDNLISYSIYNNMKLDGFFKMLIDIFEI
jgi:hypothetical protein